MNFPRKKLAILDLYKGAPNQGMRCIRELLQSFAEEVDYKEYEVRNLNQIPDLSYDIYISSGGPGSPLDGNGIWDPKWYQLISDIWTYNSTHTIKKYVFFICHSFQMACHHFNLGTISKRKSKSFGIMPVHKTYLAEKDPVIGSLNDPYFAVDSREYQILQRDLSIFKRKHAAITSLENIHTKFEVERAIMAVRFSPEFFGTQYHPEADPEGMKIHFAKKKNREYVIQNFGKQTYRDMMTHIDDEDKLEKTHKTILPGFIRYAITRINIQKSSIDN